MRGCEFENPSFSVQQPGLGKTAFACERCVYGRGYHADFCQFAKDYPTAAALDNIDHINSLCPDAGE